MSNNPLMDLFADKPRPDAEIEAELKVKLEADKPAKVVEEPEDEEDEVEEKPTKKSKTKEVEDEDEDEDDDVVPDTVPKAALLKERAKHRKQLAEARGAAKALKEVAVERPKETVETVEEEFEEPDPVKDPKGYREYMQAHTQNLVLNERMNFSEARAKDKHGDEAVDAAFNWLTESAKANPGLARQIRSHPDPYAETVRLHKESLRSGRLKDVDESELDNFRKWQKAKKEGKLAEWEAEQEKAARKAGKEQPKEGKKAAKKPAKVEPEDEDELEDDEDELPPQSLATEHAARGKDSDKIGVGAGKAFSSLFE